jgi:hypothetical protein
MADKILYEKLIDQNDIKNYQVKLVVSDFKGTIYLSIRKYFLSFDEGFVASKEGISMEFELASSFALLEGLMDICSDNEGAEALKIQIEKAKLENEKERGS